ncbi:hypothetical protein BSFA1_42010 [Burkholderia sp. SFA1]|nr:hypothetical protein BSFA1_42010 [Burkholderia sp. SFA1]
MTQGKAREDEEELDGERDILERRRLEMRGEQRKVPDHHSNGKYPSQAVKRSDPCMLRHLNESVSVKR